MAVFTKDKVIKTRNKIISLFKSTSPDLQDDTISSLIKQFGLVSDTIPAKRIDQNYNDYWANVWQLTNALFLAVGRPDLSELFKFNVPVFNEESHSVDFIATVLKGASSREAQTASQKRFELLLPFKNAMRDALLTKGISSPGDLESISELFYNTFIAEKNGVNKPLDFDTIDPVNKMHLDESLTDAIVTYFNSLAIRKQNGEVLPKALDQMASTTIQVKESLGQQAIRQVNEQIGAKLTGNTWIIWAVIAAVIGLLIWAFVRK